MDLDTITNAITQRVELEFTYDGQPRIVQPAAVGVHKDTGNVVLRGYQVGGGSNSRQPPLWDLFIVAKCGGLIATTRVFTEDPPYYRRGDKHMQTIAAEL